MFGFEHISNNLLIAIFIVGKQCIFFCIKASTHQMQNDQTTQKYKTVGCKMFTAAATHIYVRNTGKIVCVSFVKYLLGAKRHR